jgi:hypothetical protein
MSIWKPCLIKKKNIYIFENNYRKLTYIFVIVYLTITSDVDRVQLQEDLDRLAHWEQTWKMSFHPENVMFCQLPRSITRWLIAIFFMAIS